MLKHARSIHSIMHFPHHYFSVNVLTIEPQDLNFISRSLAGLTAVPVEFYNAPTIKHLKCFSKLLYRKIFPAMLLNICKDFDNSCAYRSFIQTILKIVPVINLRWLSVVVNDNLLLRLISKISNSISKSHSVNLFRNL